MTGEVLYLMFWKFAEVHGRGRCYVAVWRDLSDSEKAVWNDLAGWVRESE